MHWGKLWTTRYKKTKKPNCHFQKARSKSWVLQVLPAHNITKRVGKASKPLSGPTPGPTPALTTYKERAHSYLGRKQGGLLLIFTPLC